jgi:hypothetical protein
MLVTHKLQVAHSHYGPYGRNCVCCGPNPKFRAKHDRAVKKRINRAIDLEIKNQINQDKE